MRGRFCRREKPGRRKGYCKWRGGKIIVLGMGRQWEDHGCPAREGK